VTGTVRSSDGIDVRRRRLLFRSWHRGLREMDLIMGLFADACLSDLNDAELRDYEQLIEVPDPDLYAWISGEQPAPGHYDTGVFRRLLAFHGTGRKG
jgi:antitoxin CptB